ncbi:hypothetical protein M3689_00900 [Alkalihalophilus marmarensis]|uniref:hypothetical protein n=1 Tax=Alkalihalophilus marmarensis TaxID=521377 RepID=UPI00203DD44C|nr:hypothetical protein [Alkalihalophilus marmarensis]MCM3487857.1 hypothetical protein [Alkalihalophilus marmarensis]
MNKSVCERIAYYTKKLAQRVRVHPAHRLPRAYTYRNERLQQYKKRLNELCKVEREQLYK